MSTTPSTFHPFPLLPLELRQQIYHLASIAPRTISLHIQITPTISPPPTIKFKTIYTLSSPTSPHPLLLTSHESREVCLSILFKDHKYISISQDGFRVRFCPNRDNIFLDISTLAHLASPELNSSTSEYDLSSFRLIQRIATPIQIPTGKSLWRIQGMRRVCELVLTGMYSPVPLVQDVKSFEVLKKEYQEMWETYWKGGLELEGLRIDVRHILEMSLLADEGVFLAEQFFREV